MIPDSTVTGTINGVEVTGVCEDDLALYDANDDLVFVVGSIGACRLPDHSIPSSDLVISLTQSYRGGPVVIPEEYLDLDGVESRVQGVIDTTTAVVNKLTTVETTADAAKTTADASVVPALMLTVTWDGTTDGKTTFTSSKNGNFYKMSSLKIPIGAFVGTYAYSNGGGADELSPISISKSCYRYRNDIIVVLKPGTYVDNIMLGEFTASEPGVYFRARSGVTSYTLTINSKVDPYYNALFMISSDGTKKFKITIDDAGAIKATEVTE